MFCFGKSKNRVKKMGMHQDEGEKAIKDGAEGDGSGHQAHTDGSGHQAHTDGSGHHDSVTKSMPENTNVVWSTRPKEYGNEMKKRRAQYLEQKSREEKHSNTNKGISIETTTQYAKDTNDAIHGWENELMPIGDSEQEKMSSNLPPVTHKSYTTRPSPVMGTTISSGHDDNLVKQASTEQESHYHTRYTEVLNNIDIELHKNSNDKNNTNANNTSSNDRNGEREELLFQMYQEYMMESMEDCSHLGMSQHSSHHALVSSQTSLPSSKAGTQQKHNVQAVPPMPTRYLQLKRQGLSTGLTKREKEELERMKENVYMYKRLKNIIASKEVDRKKHESDFYKSRQYLKKMSKFDTTALLVRISHPAPWVSTFT